MVCEGHPKAATEGPKKWRGGRRRRGTRARYEVPDAGLASWAVITCLVCTSGCALGRGKTWQEAMLIAPPCPGAGCLALFFPTAPNDDKGVETWLHGSDSPQRDGHDAS